MISTWALLLNSRKFWVGGVTILAIAGTIALVALGKLSEASLVPTMTAITGLGIAIIGSIAWEDTTKAKATGTANTNQAVADMVSSVIKSIAPPKPDATDDTDKT